MVQPTQDRQRDHAPVFGRIHCSRYRTVFVQTDVRSSRVVVAVDILSENPNEMSLIDDDAMVQTLSAKTADRSLGVRILPGAFPSRDDFLNAHRLYAIPEF